MITSLSTLPLAAETRVVAWGTVGVKTGVFPVALTNVVDITAAGRTSAAVLDDGTVVGMRPDFGTPLFQLPGMVHVVKAASAEQGVVGLTEDGKGVENGILTLPLGGYIGPNQVQDVTHGFSHVVDLDISSLLKSGMGHGMAVRADGTLYGWGEKVDLTRKVVNQCVPPGGVSNFIGVAVGSFHTLALASDGSVKAWGANNLGQTNVPADLGPCVLVAAGQDASAAVGVNGVVRFWGKYPPLPVAPLERVTRIAFGPTAALALHDDGTVTGWGTYQDSQGAPVPLTVPEALSNVVAIAAGVDHFLALTCDDPVRIRQQPAGRVLEAGRSHLFHVRAIGQPPLRYQWRFRGEPIAGATNAGYLVSGITPAAQGDYEVEVSNPQGAVTSDAARLDVVSTLAEAVDAPALAWRTSADHPWGVTTDETHDGRAAAVAPTQPQQLLGETFLETEVIGPGVLSFWGKAGMDRIGGSPSFKVRIDGVFIRGLAPSQGWSHEILDLEPGRHVVRWACPLGNFPSGSPAGWVDQVEFVPGGRAPSPSQVYPGASVTLAAGSGTNFLGTFDGTPPIRYQWSHAGIEIAGATNSALALSDVQAVDAGPYTLSARNDQGQGEITIELSVAPTGPAIDVAPPDQLAVPGGIAVFACKAHGSEPLSFTWLHDGVEIPGAAGSTLVLRGLKTSDLGNYRARVSNGLGSTETPDAALRLVRSTVIAWGASANGAGIVPAGLSNVTAVAAGPNHSLALHSDGTVAAWGWNAFDLLSIPPGLSDVVAISAGGTYSAAIRRNGTVVGWGLSGGTASVPAGLSNVMAVGLCDFMGLALKSNGTLVAWGNPASSGFTDAAGFTNIAGIALDNSSGMALRRDGRIQEWGALYTRFPAGLEPLLTDVVAVGCGRSFHAALREDGSLFLWDGARWATVPPSPNRIVNISAGAGGSECLALMEDGTVSSWGVDGKPRPVADPSPANVVAIAQGQVHSLAVIHDGTPVIARQPLDRIVGAGSPLRLEAVVMGNGPFTYRWYRDGVALADQTNRLLVVPTIPMSGGGSFSCLIRSPDGTLATRSAKVAVERRPPRIDPGRLQVVPASDGQTLQFRVEGLSGVGSVKLYASDDLIHWTLVNTQPPVLGTLDMELPPAQPGPERFVRVVEE